MSAEFSKGWWLVAWTAVIVGTIAALVLAVHGPTQQGMHLVLHATALTSLGGVIRDPLSVLPVTLLAAALLLRLLPCKAPRVVA